MLPTQLVVSPRCLGNTNILFTHRIRTLVNGISGLQREIITSQKILCMFSFSRRSYLLSKVPTYHSSAKYPAWLLLEEKIDQIVTFHLFASSAQLMKPLYNPTYLNKKRIKETDR
ncbi:hypothetical protein L6164_019817 [Bauhinia variegata]|uniref:Uncharacterized protein n=1 Tax=Bauhinia variegata TaxID=167791 RepID=A0ACB9MTC7_BAUVA|nr:hypothetical protein L6164_019817 [Bauhinia variegata]